MDRDLALASMERAVKECFPDNWEQILSHAIGKPRRYPYKVYDPILGRFVCRKKRADAMKYAENCIEQAKAIGMNATVSVYFCFDDAEIAVFDVGIGRPSARQKRIDDLEDIPDVERLVLIGEGHEQDLSDV